MRTRCNLIRPISPTTVASPNKSPQWLALSILANVNATRCNLLPICPLIVLAMFCPCGLCLIHFRSLFFLAITCPSLSFFSFFFIFLFFLSIRETSLSASLLFSIPHSLLLFPFFFFFSVFENGRNARNTKNLWRHPVPFRSPPVMIWSCLFIFILL